MATREIPNLKYKKFYLAGPMTGLPDFGYPQFRAATRRLRGHLLTVASPHERWDNETEDERALRHPTEYMRHAFGLLLKCDSIVLLRGWSSSAGARQEMGLALAAGYSIYYYTPGEDYPLVEIR